jgi:NAD+ kinase
MSETRFETVGLVAKPRNPALASGLAELAELLERSQARALFDEAAADLLHIPEVGVPRSELAARVDLLLVLGGDGTLLSVAPGAAAHGVPIFGINYGGMGFMTATPRDELIAATEAVLHGTYQRSVRRLLRATVDGPTRDAAVESDVLNDAVINKTDLARVVELHATVDGEDVSSFAADGLIVCTATGSTAYSLAAGGPIVMPEVDAILLTPICPHTLTNRPLVLPGDSVVAIRQGSRDLQTILTLDGQEGVILEPDDTVTIRRSPHRLTLLRTGDRSNFDILRTKLRWGHR